MVAIGKIDPDSFKTPYYQPKPRKVQKYPELWMYWPGDHPVIFHLNGTYECLYRIQSYIDWGLTEWVLSLDTMNLRAEAYNNQNEEHWEFIGEL